MSYHSRFYPLSFMGELHMVTDLYYMKSGLHLAVEFILYQINQHP